MDFNAFKAQIEAARSIEVPVGAATYRLQLPVEHAWRVAIEANRDAGGRLLQAKAFREVLSVAIVGWQGVTTRDLLPDAVEEPLPFSPAARESLLDIRQDIADDLTVAIGLEMKARREKLEAARKN